MTFIKLSFILALSILISIATSCSKDHEECLTITDVDSNVYNTIKIGKQVWTVENLKTTKYNDGTLISQKTDDNVYVISKPSYCWYKYDIGYKDKYGAYYDWNVVNTGKLAPKGWHVSTSNDWYILKEYLKANGYSWDMWDSTKKGSKIAKSLAAKTDWTSSSKPGDVGNDMSSNNSSGFSALPGGYRNYYGHFYDQGRVGRWWTSTECEVSRGNAWSYRLRYDSKFLEGTANPPRSCYSVRLVKD